MTTHQHKQAATRPPRPRVLVIDNDPEVGYWLSSILKPRHYAVQVAQCEGERFLGQARACASAFRPHVIVLDLRLRDDSRDERSGFELLKDLPSGRCVIYSAHLPPEITRTLGLKYGITRCVSKGESPENVVEMIRQVAYESSIGRKHLRIQRSTTWSSQQVVHILFGENSDLPPESADDVLRQLFPDKKSISLTPIDEDGALPAVSRGHSVVFKAEAPGLEPVVVKLAPARQIREEAAKYYKFVKDKLVGRFYAQIDRTVEFWDLGAAIYSFMGSPKGKLPSLTRLYQEQTSGDAILTPLTHFFGEVWSRHYDQTTIEANTSLFQLYDQTLRLKRRLRDLHPAMSANSFFPGFSGQVPDPKAWTVGHVQDTQVYAVKQAITHGDLHADNLFVDGQRAWAIDFERTKPGHVLRDFVELEVDVITRLVSFATEDPRLFYELLVVLLAPAHPDATFSITEDLAANVQAAKALRVIGGLRYLAHSITHYTELQEYLWGVLLDALFVASLADRDSAQQRKALQLATAICSRLQGWDKPWPPDDWPAISARHPD